MINNNDNTQYYVCYFDFLGQRSAMKDFWNASSIISEKDKILISRVGDALRNIPYNLKRIFDLKNDDGDLLNILKRVDRETWGNFTIPNFLKQFQRISKGIQQFSDSVLYYIEANTIFSPILLFYSLIMLAKLIPKFHAINLLPRGGIGIGKGYITNDGFIYGDIVTTLMHFEENDVRYARILMKDELRTILANQINNSTVSISSKTYLNSLLSMFQIDPDGCWSLNFFSQIVIENMKSNNELSSFKYDCNNALENFREMRNNLTNELSKTKDVYKSLFLSNNLIKYELLFRLYSQSIQKIRNIDGENKFGQFGYKLMPQIKEFYIFYIKLDKICDNDCDNIESNKNQFIGMFLSDLYTSIMNIFKKLKNISCTMPKDIIKILKQHGNIQKYIQNIRYGIQQGNSQLMIYIPKNHKITIFIFLYCISKIYKSLLKILKSGLIFHAAITYGRGWEIDDNNLQGPVVGDAYDLTTKTLLFGRILVSNIMVEEICMLEHNYNFTQQHYLIKDIDGLLSLNMPILSLLFQDDSSNELINEIKTGMEQVSTCLGCIIKKDPHNEKMALTRFRLNIFQKTLSNYLK